MFMTNLSLFLKNSQINFSINSKNVSFITTFIFYGFETNSIYTFKIYVNIHTYIIILLININNNLKLTMKYLS